MSRFTNPDIPWREFERRLSRTTPDPEATGSDAPTFARPDRHTEPTREPTPARPPADTVPYAELHAHSQFSFLDGASDPEELAHTAHALGLHGLALTDHNGLYGAVRLAQAAKPLHLPTIFGAELSLDLKQKIPGQADPQATHLLVLARGVTGYRNLSTQLSTALLAGEKNHPVYDLDALTAAAGDWYILTGCRKGHLGQALAAHPGAAPGRTDPAGRALAELVERFGERVVVELTRAGLPTDDEHIARLTALAQAFDLPTVATNAVHYATRARFHDAQARAAIRARRPLSELAGHLPPNASARLRDGARMRHLFGPAPVAHTVTLARECAFELSAARAGLPHAPIPAGTTEPERLRALVTAGAHRHYGPRSHRPDAWAQLDRELAVIETMGFPGYFLIVEDIARFCRDNDIYCQGRGSAANSAVCYVLGITAVDAVRFGLLFDRFLSPERAGYPDIDLDIESDRREEVIQYVYRLYGRDHAAQVANVITYRAKSAIRDAAAALGHDPGTGDAFTRALTHHRSLPAPGQTPIPAPVLTLAENLLDTPRHLGIHSGGMILADRPIAHTVPVEPATMENRTVIQWDKDDAAAMNLVKFDLLGLGMLGALHQTIDLLRTHRLVPTDFTRTDIPKEAPEVYDMLCAGDAIGVFQVESRAQLATLPRLKPRTLYDLAIQVALIRPGPIQGGSVHPYLRRRQGTEDITYLHPSLRGALEKTLGIPLFQEQLMRMAIDTAGFTGAQADELRRAMGSRRSHTRMEALRHDFHTGAATRGIDPTTAQTIFEKIAAFADYGFPESHAISFAGLVYDSAWLKHHHPAAFTAGLLRSQPMGFYSPQSLIADARRHGVTIQPADINASAARTDIEPTPENPTAPAIRLGLDQIRGITTSTAEHITTTRGTHPYTSPENLAERTGLDPAALAALATAGTLDTLGPDRRQALWITGSLTGIGPDTLPGTSPIYHTPTLPTLSHFETTLAQLTTTGITTEAYPTEQLRAALTAAGYASTADAHHTPDHTRITVAGLITHRQRPATASGITFMNLEDEYGMLNIVCTQGFLHRYGPTALNHNALTITGLIQRADTVVSLYAHSLQPLHLDNTTLTLPTESRDFQ
jgi:error-prone DNA polymerase